jgi:hypothetical protein
LLIRGDLIDETIHSTIVLIVCDGCYSNKVWGGYTAGAVSSQEFLCALTSQSDCRDFVWGR